MYNNILAAIDIGTDSIKILVAEKREDFLKFEVLGFITTPCSGVVRGEIVDIAEVSKSIENALKELKKVYSEDISSIYINIGGSQLSSIHSDSSIIISTANKKILEKDIKRALNSSIPSFIKETKEVISVIVKEYFVDDKKVYNLKNIKGKKLKTKTLIITSPLSNIKNIKRAVLQNGININKIIPSFLADSVILSNKQKEAGVSLVNIGAGNIDISIFKNNKLLSFNTLPFGSANITNDIAINLNCKISTAEEIKKKIKILLEEENTSKKKIQLIQGKDDWKENLLFSPNKIYNEVILPRIYEIFEQIDLKIKENIQKDLLPAGVVITGGGARFFNIIEIAKSKIELNVEIGLPHLFNLIGEYPEAVTVSGLILKKYKEKNFETGKVLLRTIENNIKKIIKKLIERIKNLKQ